ncbi:MULTISPECIES: hypothetical protein [unclassified Beijerinckia]|uniref:hypothetical protein n=1 Tax=unclassified Beijerinckia TaxID=2638183 RepID=UPI00089D55FE|nr:MULTISPECIES: hypothetical protein [unclassified Beijerinckia]MDH7796194.1 hypothetical protein [Beijerinckia sp. GAS462]SEC34426.1 hypothetical protein SAMN05443249_2476 [Beijerinckia sp. 28-YEA-48]
MDRKRVDRAGEDLGNIIDIGHINLRVPDQRLATLYYVTGLGLTRDPYLMTGVDNMWVNVGQSQFHLPTGEAAYAPRTVAGLVVPDRAGLVERLQKVGPHLAGTRFSWHATNDAIELNCPWGNRARCHTPDPQRFGQMASGMAYVEFEVPLGSLAAIGRFYSEMIGARHRMDADGEGAFLRIACGPGQALIFRESDAETVVCQPHHIQIYVADFSGPYERLWERDLISEESNRQQYRFENIVDLDSGRTVFTIDHEVRSMTHPMYGRPLVNRNTVQTVGTYRAGADAAQIWL